MNRDIQFKKKKKTKMKRKKKKLLKKVFKEQNLQSVKNSRPKFTTLVERKLLKMKKIRKCV